MVQLYLFGPPRLIHAEMVVPLNHRKAWALLAYLAVTAQPHSRDTLATLFWPDYGQGEARGHLRRELARLRELLGHAAFVADREQIALAPADADRALPCDVVEFRRLVRESERCRHAATTVCPHCGPRLTQAAALYTDHFLAGFSLPDAPEFDQWHFFMREELATQQGQLLAQLAQAQPFTPNGDAPAGSAEGLPTPLHYAQRWVNHDPLHEAAHCALIAAYAQAGQWSTALRHYEHCVRLLADELGVPPADATVALGEAVRARQLPATGTAAPPAGVAVAPPAAPPPSPGWSSSAPALPTLPPPKPLLPTHANPFVGRVAELAAYSRQLAQTGVALITGMPGVGKSALALALARHVAPPTTIFWHTCQAEDGVDGLLWRLAAFLAEQGQPALWQLLGQRAQNGGAPPPLAALVDYLAQLLQQGTYLLCLDDLHQLEDEASVTLLLRRLTTLAQQKALRLIVTSRRKPTSTLLPATRPLGGLTVADTRALLQQHNFTLSADLLHQLHAETEGNGEFLLLTVHALRQTDTPATLINSIAAADDLERYLLLLMNRWLSEEEMAVMAAIAILEGYPATRAALEAIVATGRVRNALLQLSERYLLTVHHSEGGQLYHAHALVQNFFYNGLTPTERQTLHQRAAHYYETREADPLRAATHYLRAAQPAAAAQVITANLPDLIGQGRLRTVRRLLNHFTRAQLADHAWAALAVAKGQLCALLGERTVAYQAYTEAQAILATLPDQPVLHGELYLGLAALTEQASFPEAIKLADTGLAALGGADPLLAASLQLKKAGLLAALGDYTAARAAAQAGRALLPATPHMLQVAAHENLGVIDFHTGQLASAADHWTRGLAICRQLPHPFKAVELLNNLGAYQLVAGHWVEAGRAFTEGLAEANKLGTVHHQALFHLNLGILRMWQGDDEAAARHFTALRAHVGEYASNGRYSFADLRLRQGRLAEAATLLAEAEALVASANADYQLPELYTLHARLALAQGDEATATRWVEQALDRATAMGMVRDEGIALALHGTLAARRGAWAAAEDAFRRSLTLLADEPYEAARTRVAWGHALHAQGDPRAATPLWAEAQQTFTQLGAAREVAALGVFFA